MIFNPATVGNEIIVSDDFFDFMNKIRKSDIKLPTMPEIKSGEAGFEPKIDDAKISKLTEENLESYDLDAQNGCKLVQDNKNLISAYDESIAKFSALEGKAIYVSHSMVFMDSEKYYPINKLTLSFYSDSKLVRDKIKGAKPSRNEWGIDTTANVDIAIEKKDFIGQVCCDDSVIFIDGPFLAGDGLCYFKKIIFEKFIPNNIFPIFIVKNSNSNLLTERIQELKGLYNSDLHYVDTILKAGQRSAFYKYEDTKENSKVFCYLKFHEHSSPIRVEIPTEIYLKHRESVDALMDITYYLILAQGNFKNPQVRPIAIAEMFARETLKLIDFKNSLFDSNLTPTMNQVRGME